MHTPHTREDAPASNPNLAAQDRYRQGWTRGRSFGCIALAIAVLLYAPSLYGQGSDNALFIDQKGNVGIGTTNPQKKLDVRDEVYVRSLSFTDPANGQRYPNNWIGMADNITGTTKWLHIGGITDGTGAEKKRRLALYADTTHVSGNAGIGTVSPKHRLHVAGGNAYFDGDLYVKGSLVYWWSDDNVWKHIQNKGGDVAGSYTTNAPSDRRFKTDLRPISSALEKISQLRGVTYHWNQEALDYFTRHVAHTVSAGPEATEAEHHQLWQAEKARIAAQLAGANLGLIAQEVESVVPEVVTTDEAGYKAIKYPHLTALLIEAVKEQQALLAAQRADIARLQASNDALQAHVQELQAHSAAARATEAELADMRAQLAHLGAAVQRVTATRQASATEVGGVIMPRQ